MKPLIIAFYDGDESVKVLSNFATTPFTLDGKQYVCVEGFWQGLKTEVPMIREQVRMLDGLKAKEIGRTITGQVNSTLFTYEGRLYVVGSEAHHTLLERAIRAKVAQNQSVREALLGSGNAPLKHMLKNKFGQWRTGDSPRLPAVVFEKILLDIRKELREDRFQETVPLPMGVADDLLQF